MNGSSGKREPTDTQVDVFVTLSAGTAMRAQWVATELGLSDSQVGGALGGLKRRGWIVSTGKAHTFTSGGLPRYAPLWAVNHDGLSERQFARLLARHAKLHDYPLESVLTEDQLVLV